MIAVVILLRVLRECRGGGNKLSNVRSFSILRSEEGLTSCNKDKSANFFGQKKCSEAFRGVFSLFVENTRKKL